RDVVPLERFKQRGADFGGRRNRSQIDAAALSLCAEPRTQALAHGRSCARCRLSQSRLTVASRSALSPTERLASHRAKKNSKPAAATAAILPRVSMGSRQSTGNGRTVQAQRYVRTSNFAKRAVDAIRPLRLIADQWQLDEAGPTGRVIDPVHRPAVIRGRRPEDIWHERLGIPVVEREPARLH